MHVHSHGPHEHGDHSHDHSRVVSKAMWITIVFMIIEAIGGFYANSLALLSDSAHLLTDVGALLVSLFALWVARKPSTPRMSFGYHRAEILGGLASGLLIWLIAGVLCYEAFVRMSAPPAVNGPVVFVVAAVGLLANLACMYVLREARDENMNVRGAYVHMLADSLGSVGAVISGAVLWWNGWRLIDPIVTVLFSGLMLWGSWGLVREAVGILMESTPGHLDAAGVMSDLHAISGVTEAHDLHIWSVSSGRLALSVHLISENGEAVLQTANSLLQEKYGIVHTTIQVEHPDRFKSERCYDCGSPTQAERRTQG